MSENCYSIRIMADEAIFNQIDSLLQVQRNNKSKLWMYEIITKNSDSYFNFIDHFSDIIENKIGDLAKLNVKSECISFWLISECQDQCNFEFSPSQMERLSKLGITLCLSVV